MDDSIGRDLDMAVGALKAAVVRQRRAVPDLADCYAWGWALTVLAEQADTAGQVLAAQIGDYGHRHTLRDDADGPTGERVDRAVERLDEVVGYARALRAAAAAYHSEISHLGVELDPEAEEAEER